MMAAPQERVKLKGHRSRYRFDVCKTPSAKMVTVETESRKVLD